jgi:integrase
MASLMSRKSDKTGKLLWRVQVSVDRDGRKRPTVPLGNLTKAKAETIKGYIESLAASKRAGVTMEGPTADWLATIGDDLHRRLAKLGLCSPRQQAEPTAQRQAVLLGEFIDGYIDGRAKLKPSTVVHLKRCQNYLTGYFGADRPIDSISQGDADEFREHLGQRLAENTVRRTCGRAKQFFRAAQRKKLIAESPFGDMKGTGVKANRSRDYFVTRAEAEAVLKACPDTQWKLLFALSRYGGLRCPSEHLALTWGDVNWKLSRITIPSPKTAHHGDGHESRVMPLFPELLPYLEAAWTEFLEDFDPKAQRLSEQFVITRYRERNSNLRTQLNRIIKAAGLTAWPKLFQNLRASRATELAAEFPGHVAAAWLGHSNTIADKHYRQVTDADFDRALFVAKSLRQPTETGEPNGEGRTAECANQLDVRISPLLNSYPVTPTGLEPVLPA